MGDFSDHKVAYYLPVTKIVAILFLWVQSMYFALQLLASQILLKSNGVIEQQNFNVIQTEQETISHFMYYFSLGLNQL